MQSADSSLGLSWWLLYQMPGKLQGFKPSEPLGSAWNPTTFSPLAYVEFIYTLRRQIAQARNCPVHKSCALAAVVAEVIPSERSESRDLHFVWHSRPRLCDLSSHLL
jgi:hypothetical protein